MSEEDFDFFRSTISRLAGISLSKAKFELVKSRLHARLQSLGFTTYSAYKDHLRRAPTSDPEWQIFVNLLTTNKTDFFREPEHFNYLAQTYLPQWRARRRETLRIWSAACSTGEEPYSIAMHLARALPSEHDCTILASDIDSEVLAVARNAVYPRPRLAEIPHAYHHDCLTFGRDGLENWFRIKPHVKSRLDFKLHNLIHDRGVQDEEFDVVFCRNVLIYFAPETVAHVAQKLFRCVRPGGLLLIGHSESLQSFKTPWKYAAPSIYLKP